MLPSGIEVGDCRRVPQRSGRLVVWDDCAGVPHTLGKFSVWGQAFSNVSVSCRLKGHTKCRKAFGVLDASKEQLEHWLLDGANMSAEDHMKLPLRVGIVHVFWNPKYVAIPGCYKTNRCAASDACGP